MCIIPYMRIDNDRWLTILYEMISNKQEYITAEHLADLMNVSVRTVKSDISDLNQELQADNEAEILSVKAHGYKLMPIDNVLFTKLYNVIERMHVFYRNKSIQDLNIRVYIVQRMLSSEYTKIEEFADELFLSKSSLRDCIAWVRKYFVSYRLTIASYPSKGMRVEGNEEDLRACMCESYFSLYHEVEQLYPVNEFTDMFFDSEETYQDVRHAFLKILRESKICVRDIDTKKLALTLCLMKQRLAQDKFVKLAKEEYSFFTNSYEYNLVQTMLQNDAIRNWVVVDQPMEIAYLAKVLFANRDFSLANQNCLDTLPNEIIDEAFVKTKKVLDVMKQKLPTIENIIARRNLFVDFSSLVLRYIVRDRYERPSAILISNYLSEVGTYSSPAYILWAREVQTIICDTLHLAYPAEETGEDKMLSLLLARFFLTEPFTYKKRRIALMVISSIVIGERMQQELIDNYGGLIEYVHVFETYELRRIRFEDYDIAIAEATPAFYYYDLKKTADDSLIYTEDSRNFFEQVFYPGFDETEIRYLIDNTKIFDDLQQSDMSSLMSFINHKYIDNRSDSKHITPIYSEDSSLLQIMKRISKEGEILFHLYCLTSNTYYDFRSKVKYVVVVSIGKDCSPQMYKIIDRLLNYLKLSEENILGFVNDNEKVTMDIFKTITYKAYCKFGRTMYNS